MTAGQSTRRLSNVSLAPVSLAALLAATLLGGTMIGAAITLQVDTNSIGIAPTGVAFDRGYDRIEAMRGAATVPAIDTSYDQVEKLRGTIAAEPRPRLGGP
jgi:hypothetical protein